MNAEKEKWLLLAIDRAGPHAALDLAKSWHAWLHETASFVGVDLAAEPDRTVMAERHPDGSFRLADEANAPDLERELVAQEQAAAANFGVDGHAYRPAEEPTQQPAAAPAAVDVVLPRPIRARLPGDWSDDEIAILRQGYADGLSRKQVRENLGGRRTISAIGYMAGELGIVQAGVDPPWAPAEIDTLVAEYAKGTPPFKIGELLGRKTSGVTTKAWHLGVRMHREWTAEERRRLEQAAANGERLVDVAEEMGRKYAAVAKIAQKMGLSFIRPLNKPAAAAPMPTPKTEPDRPNIVPVSPEPEAKADPVTPTTAQVYDAVCLYPGKTARELSEMWGYDHQPLTARLAMLKTAGRIHSEAGEMGQNGRPIHHYYPGKLAEPEAPAPPTSEAQPRRVVQEPVSPFNVRAGVDRRPAPRKDDSAAMIAAHIAAKGVTKCPTVALEAVGGIAVPPEERAAIRAHDEALHEASKAGYTRSTQRGAVKGAATAAASASVAREVAR